MIPVPNGLEYWIFLGDYPTYGKKDISLKDGSPSWAKEEFEEYTSVLGENLEITSEGKYVEVYR